MSTFFHFDCKHIVSAQQERNMESAENDLYVIGKFVSYDSMSILCDNIFRHVL